MKRSSELLFTEEPDYYRFENDILDMFCERESLQMAVKIIDKLEGHLINEIVEEGASKHLIRVRELRK